METSQDTAPAGSKYLAFDRARWALLPRPRGALRLQRLRAWAVLLLAQLALRSRAPFRRR